jgi:TfoX N-terminal domain
MAYDLDLERKLDRLSAKIGPFAKKNLYGGVAYLLNGNMVFGIHKQYLIIRTSKELAKELLTKDFISIFDITGRPMMGWLMVSPEGLKTEEQISDLLRIAIDYVKTLPRK